MSRFNLMSFIIHGVGGVLLLYVSGSINVLADFIIKHCDGLTGFVTKHFGG